MEGEALPSDVIFEILTRSSLDTLDRCKAVSKTWKQMIYEATFLRLHTKQSHCVFGYIFQDVINNRYRSALVSEEGGGGSWPFDEMRVVASSDKGLLCCEKISHKYNNHRYFACKPATNQWQPLPNPKLRYRTAAVAIVVCKSSPLRYIIVRLSEHGINYRFEVFDSQIWAWEKTEPPILSDFISPHKAAVTVGQSVYWLTNEGNVLAFDINERSFGCLRSPETMQWCKQLVEYEGGLAFTCMDEERKKMEMWRHDDEGKWTRNMVVDMSAVGEALSHNRLIEFCNSDVAFVTTDDGAAFYNFGESGLMSRVEVPYHLRNARHILRFRSDLEIVNLKCC